MMPNAQTVANSWAQGMSTAGEKIKAGVNAVTESPTAKAAARADAYMAGVQRAIASGKWQSALQAVTLQDWKTAMNDKGVTRIAAGAAAAKPKFQQFMTEFLPYLQQGVQQLSSMPRGDIETNIQRAVSMMRWNSGFRRAGR
jgi:hypothetical protein